MTSYVLPGPRNSGWQVKVKQPSEVGGQGDRINETRRVPLIGLLLGLKHSVLFLLCQELGLFGRLYATRHVSGQILSPICNGGNELCRIFKSFAVSLGHLYLVYIPYAGWGFGHLDQGILIWLSWDRQCRQTYHPNRPPPSLLMHKEVSGDGL